MELLMPDLGEGIAEGEIARWLVKPGDVVVEDQVVLEVMTDKATVEIPTNFAGVVEEVLAKEGDVVAVGQAVVRFNNAGATAKKTNVAVAAPAASPATKAPQSAPAPFAAPAITIQTSGGNISVQAAPAVRKAARERGIDLASIEGSGPNGRVLLTDLERSGSRAPVVSARANGGSDSLNKNAPGASRTYTPGSGREERIPLRGLRKRIVEKMAQSKRTAAHFTCVEECDVTELVAFRSSVKDSAKERGVNLTFMPFIAKACVNGLRKYPQLNASLVEDGAGGGEIVRKHFYNFGIAVDTEEGLTVPVVHDVDRKTILDLAHDINDVGQRARERKLGAQDFADSTFSITNAGKVGGLFATPVINYPEVAILGVHEIRKRPMVVDNEIKIRDVMYLSISIDHRVVDGATGILFLNEVISYLSNPKKFLLEMV